MAARTLRLWLHSPTTVRPHFCQRFLRIFRGFGKLPNKQNPRPARQRRNGDLRKWVPASYACYESFFLLPITTESPVLPNLRKRKTLQSQKRLQRFLNPIQF